MAPPHPNRQLPPEACHQLLLLLAHCYDQLCGITAEALGECEWRSRQAVLEADMEAEQLAMRLAASQVGSEERGGWSFRGRSS